MKTKQDIQILLVEDNEDHAELILRSLAEHHVANKITHASDGAEALDILLGRGPYLESPALRPDLVLLDLRLPKVNGLEVLSAVRRSETISEIPIVILTTSEGEQDIAKAYELKANAYVVKPVDFSKFVELMRDLGLFWLAWNRRPANPAQ